MIEFTGLEELNKAFMTGKFKLDSEFKVEGVVYELHSSAPISIVEAVNGKHPIAVYVTEGSTNLLLFCWEVNSRNALQPSGCAIVEDVNESWNKKEDKEHIIIEMNGDKLTIRPDQLVGDLVKVSFTGLSAPKELMGKVDTGASVSSLHCDNYKINGQQIQFSCKPLTENMITVPLKTQHAVKSPDGGTVYRPVIELDVKVNGKLIKGAMFNLNDRSNMDQPVLIGQNILQSGKFYVDPSRTESVTGIDWEILQEHANIVPMLHRHANDEVLAEFYKQMLESDITFNDLVRHIKWEVIKTFEEIE